MSFINYFNDNIKYIIIFIISIFINSSILYLADTLFIVIILVNILFLFLSIFIFLDNYFKKDKFYKELLKILNELEEKTLLLEIVEEADFIEGKILGDILEDSNKYMNDSIRKYEKENLEYKEYIETWVHEIKTPITSSKLIIENNPSIVANRIGKTIEEIEGYVDQALYFARSTSVKNDFKVEKTTLKQVVSESIRQYSKVIIDLKGEINLYNLDSEVFTDTKWLSFIVGQVISNSIKYKNEKLKIEFIGEESEKGVILKIKDNGIGVAEEDVSRVFEKGFTGVNGRIDKKSTGIGLYLCKKLCSQLNISIKLKQRKTKGTVIELEIPINKFENF